MNTTADPLGIHLFVQMIQQGFAANWPLLALGVVGLFCMYALIFKR